MDKETIIRIADASEAILTEKTVFACPSAESHNSSGKGKDRTDDVKHYRKKEEGI